mmetsp:Transcript_22805/g.51432  ORF Transcript_22805/g.51432 Transcript_22805/m.51432 type:complete len:235 (+) Transcript_22805:86-790(+)
MSQWEDEERHEMGSRHGTPKAPVERPKVPPGAAARRTLIKDTTGTVRISSYDLPRDGTIYGKKQTGEGEGAGDLMSKLSVHSPSPSATSDQDIVKCNKLAIKHKLISPKEQYNFQLANQHIKKSAARHSMFDHPEIPFKGPFGVPSYPRPPDGSGQRFKPPDGSINKVINAEFMSKSRKSELYPDTSQRVVPGRMPPVKGTKSSTLKHFQGEPEAPPRFVMKKFQNIPAKITTK